MIIRITGGTLEGVNPWLVIFGMLSVLAGTKTGELYVNKLPASAMKKLVYAFVGISGAIIILQEVL